MIQYSEKNVDAVSANKQVAAAFDKKYFRVRILADERGYFIMKKFISAVVVCFMLFSAVSVFADSAEIVINGENAVIGEGMGSVTEKDGIKFVPLRFVLEYLGYGVTWNGEERLVFGRNTDGDVLIMQVGSVHWVLNNENLELPAVPYINEADSRTYVPFASFAEALGYETAVSEDGKSVSMIAKTEDEPASDVTEGEISEEIKTDENTEAAVDSEAVTSESTDAEKADVEENIVEEDNTEKDAENADADTENTAEENESEAE